MSFKVGDSVTPVDTFDSNYGEIGIITNIINGKLLSSIHKDTYEVEYTKFGGKIFYLYTESSIKLHDSTSATPYPGNRIKVTISDKTHPLHHLNARNGTIRSATYLSKPKDYFDVEIDGEPGMHIMHTSEFKIIEDIDLFGDLFDDEPTIKTFVCPPHKKSAQHMELRDKNYERWFYCKICGLPMEQFDPLKKVDNHWPKR